MTTSEVSTAAKTFNISTEIAFIRYFMEMKGIPLEDFLSIHDSALSYLNSLKNGYSDCSVKLQPEFQEFWNPWNGGFNLSTEMVLNCLSHLEEIKPELESALSSIPSEILDSDMSVLMEDEKFRKENNVVWAETREHYNSVYHQNDVPITARAWFSMRLEKVKSQIVFLNSIKDKTQSEMEDRYGYTFADVEKVFSLLSKESSEGTSLALALHNVSRQLKGAKEIRAYLSFVLAVIHAWIDGLPLEYWFKVVEKHHQWKREREMFAQ